MDVNQTGHDWPHQLRQATRPAATLRIGQVSRDLTGGSPPPSLKALS